MKKDGAGARLSVWPLLALAFEIWLKVWDLCIPSQVGRRRVRWPCTHT